MLVFRVITVILPLVLFLACSDPKEEVASIESKTVKSAGSMAAESDLKVTAKLNSSKTILPDQRIEISPSLINTSTTEIYRVIKPSDGSSDGRREPHVFYTVQYQGGGGQWIDAPRRTRYGCGVYNRDWARDFHDLPPGGKLGLNKWISRANREYEFQRPGKYRVKFHYKYRGDTFGTNFENGTAYGPGNLPKEVRDISPFHVESDPIEIIVERPLDIRLRAKQAHVSGSKIPLADMFELDLWNSTDESIEVVTNYGLRFEIYDRGSPPSIDSDQVKKVSKVTLGPEESVSIIGGENGFNGIWRYPIHQNLKVRAVFRAITLGDSVTINSNWVVFNSTEN